MWWGCWCGTTYQWCCCWLPLVVRCFPGVFPFIPLPLGMSLGVWGPFPSVPPWGAPFLPAFPGLFCTPPPCLCRYLYLPCYYLCHASACTLNRWSPMPASLVLSPLYWALWMLFSQVSLPLSMLLYYYIMVSVLHISSLQITVS